MKQSSNRRRNLFERDGAIAEEQPGPFRCVSIQCKLMDLNSCRGSTR